MSTRLTFIAALLMAGLLSACSKAPEETTAEPTMHGASSEDGTVDDSAQGGQPVTIHARIQYISESSAPQLATQHKLESAFYIATDAIRYDDQGTVSYAMQDGSRVQGTLNASGNAHIVSDDAVADEAYQMKGDWPELIQPNRGLFRIKNVEPSHVGEGMEVTIEMEVPVQGSKKSLIQNKELKLENSEIKFSNPVECSPVNETEDLCKILFTMDVVPTEARDAAGEQLLASAQELYKHQGKIGADNSLIVYSSLVPVYGAKTTMQGEHFISELDDSYQVQMDGSTLAQHLKIVAWSTARGDLNEPVQAKAMTE